MQAPRRHAIDAATLIQGRRTGRSALKLPLNVAEQEFPVCNVSEASGQGQLLQKCKIIIWDECTMAFNMLRTNMKVIRSIR